jgi:dipeptidyl aminopeptidase/acylaminoacyl peptidase
MVNYRGSTGYGQKFADAIFGDQHGAEAQDVLYGTSSALRRYLWLDRSRLGLEGVSYGGFVCALLLGQTGMFRAAISTAGIINPITYNYRTNNNQYVHMAYGLEPHQQNLMDRLWQSAPLRFVAAVRTPTLLMHGGKRAVLHRAERRRRRDRDGTLPAGRSRNSRSPAHGRQHRPQYPVV